MVSPSDRDGEGKTLASEMDDDLQKWLQQIDAVKDRLSKAEEGIRKWLSEMELIQMWLDKAENMAGEVQFARDAGRSMFAENPEFTERHHMKIVQDWEDRFKESHSNDDHALKRK